jgi:hypothetical protein
MWKQRPASQLVDGWIEEALELAEPRSPTRVRALITRAYRHQDKSEEPAVEATELAEQLGDAELRSFAWMARGAMAFYHQRFEEAREWTWRRFDLLPEINDPDHTSDLLENAVPIAASLGRFDEARGLAQQHVELSQHLSSHHRVHGIALTSELDELAGRWGAIQERTARVEELVAANAATPCVRNARTLLLCAAASEYAGDTERSRELEAEAAEFRLEGHPAVLEGAEIRLALARGDLEYVESGVMQSERNMTFGLMLIPARLDGLAALHDRARVEAEAPRFLHPSTYLEPFALRALGIVREDDALIEQAQERFEEMKLDWHAAQTDILARGV